MVSEISDKQKLMELQGEAEKAAPMVRYRLKAYTEIMGLPLWNEIAYIKDNKLVSTEPAVDKLIELLDKLNIGKVIYLFDYGSCRGFDRLYKIEGQEPLSYLGNKCRALLGGLSFEIFNVPYWLNDMSLGICNYCSSYMLYIHLSTAMSSYPECAPLNMQNLLALADTLNSDMQKHGCVNLLRIMSRLMHAVGESKEAMQACEMLIALYNRDDDKYAATLLLSEKEAEKTAMKTLDEIGSIRADLLAYNIYKSSKKQREARSHLLKALNGMNKYSSYNFNALSVRYLTLTYFAEELKASGNSSGYTTFKDEANSMMKNFTDGSLAGYSDVVKELKIEPNIIESMVSTYMGGSDSHECVSANK